MRFDLPYVAASVGCLSTKMEYLNKTEQVLLGVLGFTLFSTGGLNVQDFLAQSRGTPFGIDVSLALILTVLGTVAYLYVTDAVDGQSDPPAVIGALVAVGVPIVVHATSLLDTVHNGLLPGLGYVAVMAIVLGLVPVLDDR